MKNCMQLGLFGYALALLVAPAGAQTTWYVDAKATGPGAGTVEDPFLTIQAALIAPGFATGDDVSVAPGVYAEDLVFTGAAEGVHIRSQGGPLVTTLAAVSPSSTSVTFEDGETIEGFTLLGQGATSRGAWSPYTHSGVLRRCIVRGYGTGCENEYDMQIYSTTIAFNDVGLLHWGGGIGGDAFTDCFGVILWGNLDDSAGNGFISPWFDWVHSTFDDPDFWSDTDLHLRSTSIARDAGHLGEPLDPDGTRADIGAVAYDGNYPVGTTYCLAGMNSSGERGRIELTGTGRIAANDLGLHAHGLPPGVVSLFFIGTQAVDAPLANGRLCAGGHIGRLGVEVADGSGVASHAFDNGSSLGGAPAIAAGQPRTFQNWFRDVPAGGAESDLTNAVAVPFTP